MRWKEETVILSSKLDYKRNKNWIIIKVTFFYYSKYKNFYNELTENININNSYIKNEIIRGNENFGILTVDTENIPSSRFSSFVV